MCRGSSRHAAMPVFALGTTHMTLVWVKVPSVVIWQKYVSVCFSQYLVKSILIGKHAKAESWHAFLNKLVANDFLWKYSCSGQIRTWISVCRVCSVIISVRNCRNHKEAKWRKSLAVYLNLTAAVVVSQCKLAWVVSPWAVHSFPSLQQYTVLCNYHRGGTDYGDCSYRARTTPLG